MFYGLLHPSATAHTSPTTTTASPHAAKTPGLQWDEVPAWPWPALYTGPMVEVDLATWNLEIGGLVSEPRSYRFSELLDGFPKITQNRRWVTVMGWTTRAAWDGVLLQHLVDKARPSSEVQWIRQEDLLGHVEYLPFRETLHQRALLAYGVGGQRLPTLYGGPLMTMVFHRYSYKGLGQLRRLDLVAEPGQNYSQGAFGWDPHGEIQPSTAYAWDLKTKKPLRHAGEITDY